jgi:hypothetical protein
VRRKIEVVWLSRHLFFKARISFRAVGRVLRLWASDLGLTRAPCPQTVINWGSRLSLVRIECARGLRALPLARAPGTNGLRWRIARSLGLGPGTLGAVVALDAQHSPRCHGAPSLEHGHCSGGSVAEAWTGATMAVVLRRLIAPMGRPAASLQDGGSARHTAVDGREARGLASPGIDDIAHAAASRRRRSSQPHPACARFLSAGGRVAGTRTHTLLACWAPPTVRPQARLLPVHRLCTWAEQLRQLAPAGGAKAGAILARLRAGLDARPACQALLKRFRGEAPGRLACQQMRTTTGRSHDTLAQGAPRRATMPTAAVRQECRASLAVQRATAQTLGLEHVGVPIRSDPRASLFGGAKHHGVGQTQEAARLARRWPA